MKEYWYLWLIFAALVVLTAVVMIFAGRALSSHNEQTKKMLAELDRLKELKEKFKNLTAEVIDSSESKELLEGVTAVLQARIEKADSGEAEFETFNEVQKNIYTLNYFVEDVSESLSFFFKNNGKELTDIIVSAIEGVNAKKILNLVKVEYAMYDENNEAVSQDCELISKTDEEFVEMYSEKELLESIKEYIKNNIDKF